KAHGSAKKPAAAAKKPASWGAETKAPKSEFGASKKKQHRGGVQLPPQIETPNVGDVTLKPGEKRLKVVVTGYGDFGGTWDEAAGRPNPSGEIAKQLASMGLKNADIEYRKLPVTHDAGDNFMKEMQTVKPDVVISNLLEVGYTV